MDEGLLISLVRKYPELYDFDDSRYHNDQHRNEKWEQIAEEMSEAPLTCKEKWRKIRENFRKAIILRLNKTGQANYKPIRYSKELNFILPFLLRESKPLPKVSISSDDGDEDEEENSTLILPPSKRRTRSASAAKSKSPTIPAKRKKSVEAPVPTPTQPTTVSPIQPNVEKIYVQPNEDPTVNFFKSLGQTVKDFPSDLKVRVKKAVFSIVTEAEEEFIQRSQAITTPAFVPIFITKSDPIQTEYSCTTGP